MPGTSSTRSIEIDTAVLETFQIVQVQADTFRFVRDARAVKRGARDHVLINVLERGRFIGRLNGRDVSIDAGGVFLSTLQGTQDLELQDATWIGLVLPRPLVEEYARWPRTLNGSVFPPNSVEATLLAHHLRSLLALPHSLSELDPRLVQRATIRHVAECLGLRPSPSDSAARPKNPDATTVRRFIAKHIGNRELGPDFVCRSFAISRSSLYRLLGPGGVQSIALTERLQAVHHDIASGRFARHPFKLIARNRGVGDLRGFRRAFVREFGYTPSDLRARSDRPAEAEAQPARLRVLVDFLAEHMRGDAAETS